MANSMRTAASNREKADAEKADADEAAANTAADAQRQQELWHIRQIRRRSPTQKSTEMQNKMILDGIINKAFIEGCLQ